MSQKLEAVEVPLNLDPVNLDPGKTVQIAVESVLPKEQKQPKTFLQTAKSLQLRGNPDWSEKIDQYLYGETIALND